MELIYEIENWKSIRRYQDKEVENDKITACLIAAHNAPSWENYQPWHFIVITDPENISLLTELSGGQRFVGKAPVIILAAAEMSCFSDEKAREQLMELVESMTDKPADVDFVNRAYVDKPLMTPGKLGDEIILARALEQLAYGVSFLVLEAVHQGLGCCVVGAFGNRATMQFGELQEELSRRLDLPEDVLPLVMVTLGYPDENPKPRPRKEIIKICHREKFGNPWS